MSLHDVLGDKTHQPILQTTPQSQTNKVINYKIKQIHGHVTLGFGREMWNAGWTEQLMQLS